MLADVQSANVVGYLTSGEAAPAGFKLYTPTFTEVGEENASTMIMKPVALSGSVPIGDSSSTRISFQKLDAAGGQSGTKLFWKDDTNTSGKKYGPGWCTGTGNVAQDVQIAPGEGIFITYPAGCDNCTLQFSGQVKGSESFVALKKGFTLTGNSTPVAIKLGNIIPVASGEAAVPDGSVSADRISFQKLDASGGQSGAKLFWKNYTNASGKQYGPGWCTGTGNAAQDIDIAPGEGIFITCNAEQAESIFLKIPGVKLTEDKE